MSNQPECRTVHIVDNTGGRVNADGELGTGPEMAHEWKGGTGVYHNFYLNNPQSAVKDREHKA